ncbi:vacuolar protein sorting-associated protein 45, partial [Conglomerata obtusa]
MVNPCYDDYIILFTNEIASSKLTDLAKADLRGLISEVYEIYVDCSYEDDNLYLIDKNTEIGHCNIKRITEGVYSILKTLNISPLIYVQNDSECAGHIAKELRNLTNKLSQDGDMIIIDRKIDLYTPLVYNWTFQSMIYDSTKYEGGVVESFGKIFNISKNEMFNKLKFQNINTVALEIQNYTKRINETKISASVVQNIEEKVRKNEIAETLLTLHNNIINDCIKNKDLSEMEHKIMKNNSIKVKELKDICKNKAIPFAKRLKMLIIFLLRNNINLDRLDDKNKVLEQGFSYEFPEFYDSVAKYNSIYLVPKFKEKISYEKDLDCKLGYQSIIKKIIDKYFRNKLEPAKFTCIQSYKVETKLHIICMIGGLTFLEYKNLCEIFEERKKLKPNEKILIITDRMLGWKDI